MQFCCPTFGVELAPIHLFQQGSTVRYFGESQILDAPQNLTRFIYIGSQPGSGRSPPVQFWKPVQNLRAFGRPPTATAAFPRRFLRPKSARNPAPAAPRFPPIFTKSVTSPLEHFFVTFFAPFCPSFSLVRSPKNRNVTLSLKLQHLRGPFRALRRTAERPSLSHRNDEPKSPAKDVQNWRRPRIPVRPRQPTCTYESIPNSDELSYDSTNDNTTAGPQPDLLQTRQQFPFLTPLSSLLSPRPSPHPKS